jgi:hypothetical protein
LEEILISLYASAINISISWIWGGDIDAKLGNPMNRYKAEGNVATVTEIADWLRDQAVRHHPSSEFARQFAARRSRSQLNDMHYCRRVTLTKI